MWQQVEQASLHMFIYHVAGAKELSTHIVITVPYGLQLTVVDMLSVQQHFLSKVHHSSKSSSLNLSYFRE